MLILVTYDVCTETAAGKRRLNKIAKICCNYGQRVQNSVFECDLDAAQFLLVKAKLLEAYNEGEDSLRFYRLGNKYQQRIEQYGCKRSYDPEDTLIVSCEAWEIINPPGRSHLFFEGKTRRSLCILIFFAIKKDEYRQKQQRVALPNSIPC